MTVEIARPRVFSRLLCQQASQRTSGILIATRGRLRRLFCLQEGWLVYAASNLVEEQFLEVLVRKEVMEPARRAEIIEEAARSGKKPTEILRASEDPSPAIVRRSFEELIRELLTSSLEWPDGEFTFEPGHPKLDGELTVPIDVLGLVLAHARRYPTSLDAVRIRIGPPDLQPVVTEDAAQLFEAAELDPVSREVIAACDGERDLGTLIVMSSHSEEATLRAIHGLLMAGILEPAEIVRKPTVETTPLGELTREECVARLGTAKSGDHYGVLGLERLATPTQVRDAYYALARRYHPDRFRSGDLQDLLGRFETYFSMVTDAYNTLGEASRRREYDESLVAGVDIGGPKPTETGQIARQNFLRGRALAQVRKWNDAITFLENAAKLEPRNADYNLEAGLLLARNPRRRADAERYLLKTIEISPAAVKAYMALGQVYARANHAAPAARMLREVLRWDKHNEEARALLESLGPIPEATTKAGHPVFTS